MHEKHSLNFRTQLISIENIPVDLKIYCLLKETEISFIFCIFIIMVNFRLVLVVTRITSELLVTFLYLNDAAEDYVELFIYRQKEWHVCRPQ